MQVPDNLNQTIEDTPFGRVTLDIHRAYGSTQMVKLRQQVRVKTDTIESAGAVIGQHLGSYLTQRASGRLNIEVSFQNGQLKFTVLEAFLD